MGAPFNSKDFKSLQAKWYGKLKKSGFEDVEQADGNLKKWHSRRVLTHFDPVDAAAIEEYYRLAGQFLHDYKFSCPAERRIWELHANGASIDDIVRVLKKSNTKLPSTEFKGVHMTQKVNHRILQLAETMKRRQRGQE